MAKRGFHTDWKVKRQMKEDAEAKIATIRLLQVNAKLSDRIKEQFYRPPYGKIGEVGACYAEVSR